MIETMVSLSRLALPEWEWRQWTTLALAMLLIACLPWALSDADWLELPAVLWRAAIWGSAAGWLAARWGHRHRGLALALLVISGLLFSGLHHSRALPPL